LRLLEANKQADNCHKYLHQRCNEAMKMEVQSRSCDQQDCQKRRLKLNLISHYRLPS